MIKGLEHTAIASPNPGRLATWYVDFLGFTINYHYEANVFVKAPDGSVLEIVPSEGERASEGLKAPGIRHLALLVDDFDGAYARLNGLGVAFLSKPTNVMGNRLVFFKDLDGNYLHLIHRETPLP